MTRAATSDAEIYVTVPQEYRDYLLVNWNRRWYIGLTFYAAFFAFVIFYGLVWTEVVQAILTIYGATYWLRERRKSWQYVFNLGNMQETQMIQWVFGNLVWGWNGVWHDEFIRAVEQDDWRSLRRLRLIVGGRNPKFRKVLEMVYAPEDREKVETQILPLIEDYRKRYWHHLWSEGEKT